MAQLRQVLDRGFSLAHPCTHTCLSCTAPTHSGRCPPWAEAPHCRPAPDSASCLHVNAWGRSDRPQWVGTCQVLLGRQQHRPQRASSSLPAVPPWPWLRPEGEAGVALPGWPACWESPWQLPSQAPLLVPALWEEGRPWGPMGGLDWGWWYPSPGRAGRQEALWTSVLTPASPQAADSQLHGARWAERAHCHRVVRGVPRPSAAQCRVAKHHSCWPRRRGGTSRCWHRHAPGASETKGSGTGPWYCHTFVF